jgi:hypothetical protein
MITLCLSGVASAEGVQEVDTTHIRANKELPKVLYVVPWKDVSSRKNTEQKLVLPELFGDLYDPLLPDSLLKNTAKMPSESK